jgi:hypothetical protein
MEKDVLLEWQAYEYEARERSRSWFAVLGIVGGGAVIGSIVIKNFLFGVIIVIGALLIALFAMRKPSLITFRITEKGIAVGRQFHPYRELEAFYVPEESPHAPRLLIQSKRLISPLIVIPIEHPDEIRALLEPKLTEREIEEPFIHHLLDYFGL